MEGLLSTGPTPSSLLYKKDTFSMSDKTGLGSLIGEIRPRLCLRTGPIFVSIVLVSDCQITGAAASVMALVRLIFSML